MNPSDSKRQGAHEDSERELFSPEGVIKGEFAEGAEGNGGTSLVEGMYREWFLDYASYVILDRAIPSMDDGLKPVQRRLLHALNELDDGRYNKAANVIGHTMRYHPHGDAAIADAMVKLAQKELLIDTQGNWGNIYTGDRAAAARYIEARLSSFAKTVVFNPHLTSWQPSYDGRNQEPETLPIKFPLLLAIGTEGIAVGLATKILPHNFCELIQESIAILRGHKPRIYPDFPTGGIADFSEYNDGRRGGKIKVRAVIEVVDNKTLRIREIPFGTTTTGLIESILAAQDKGKLKIRRVEDNTAQEVDIRIHLPAGTAIDATISALYAATECEASITPNCCVIDNGHPVFCSISEVLQRSTARTKDLLQKELEIERERLKNKLHFAKLEQVFIEQRVYRKIEGLESWDEVLAVILKNLKPFQKQFARELTLEDATYCTEIRIKRLSKFDAAQADAQRAELEKNLEEVEEHLANLVRFAIDYFRALLKKYGPGRERRTKMETFGKGRSVVAAPLVTEKVYVDKAEGFIGTSLKDKELLGEFGSEDWLIAFRSNGHCMIVKVSDKSFVGKDIIAVYPFKKNDERCIYHLLYRDGPQGSILAKRFNMLSVLRDKDYDLTRGTEGSKVLYLSSNPNGEQETVSISLKQKGQLTLDFATLAVKTRQGPGTVVAKGSVSKIALAGRGASTLAAQRVWYNPESRQLNTAEEGLYLGKFQGEEKLVVVYSSGSYEVIPFAPALQFMEDVLELQKFGPDLVLTVVYRDPTREEIFVKRVAVDEVATGRQIFANTSEGAQLLLATLRPRPKACVTFSGRVEPKTQTVDLEAVVEVRGIKAVGNKLSPLAVKSVSLERSHEA